MAAPLTPTQLLEVVKNSGLPYYEMPGWRGRCRCHNGNHEQGIGPNGRGWGPIYSTVIHHTAGASLSGQAAINYSATTLNLGRVDTPGPLVQISIDADGRVIICAAGRSNQAGSVSQVAINHMIASDFRLDIPYQDVRGSNADGNTHTYGFEIQAIDVPNDIQTVAAERLAASFARFYGWSGQETCGHGEIASSKVQSDPGLDMGAFRRAVMSFVSTGASASSSSTTTATQEEIMLAGPADIKNWYEAVGNREPSFDEVDAWWILGAGIDGGPELKVQELRTMFMGSDEMRRKAVVEAFATYIHPADGSIRVPSQKEIDDWMATGLSADAIRRNVRDSTEAKKVI